MEHKKRRGGKLSISQRDYEKEPMAAILAMIGFLPYRVEYLPLEYRFELIGTSPLFGELKDGDMIPDYNLVWDSDSRTVSVRCA